MAYSFGSTIGDKLGRIQTDTSGLDEARKVGGGIRRAVGDVLGAYRAGKVEDEAQKAKATGEENKAKVQAIVQEYNNQASPEYEGMTPSQRALKVSRLLYPLDQPMSQRYEDYARSIQQTQGKYEQEQKVADTKVEARAGELATKKAQQAQAQADFNQAVEAWNKDPQNQALINAVNLMHGNLKASGVPVVNPVEQQIRKDVIENNQNVQAQRLSLEQANAEWRRLMDERGSEMDEQKLNLELQKFANDVKANANKPSGSTLPAETVAKISNLQTVLESLGTIESEIARIKSEGASVSGLRNAKYAVNLAVENLGRVQSGGAISNDEVRNFKGLISPSVLDLADGGDQYLRNVAALKQSINNKIKNLSSEGRTLTTPLQGSVQPEAPSTLDAGFKIRKRNP